MPADRGYFHAEFRRNNPFGGWGHEIRVNTPEADIVNREEPAWRDNYVILETVGWGHYIGCNLPVANFQGTWWGEGDDMIWVDGYKWPPDLHGTGSEDYLNQAWGMQPNAFLRNGSSIHEDHTGGYQTSYVLHLENPVRFQREIKVTLEHGHGNHLANDWASVAYWYAETPDRHCCAAPGRQADAGAARQPGQLAPRSTEPTPRPGGRADRRDETDEGDVGRENRITAALRDPVRGIHRTVVKDSLKISLGPPEGGESGIGGSIVPRG